MKTDKIKAFEYFVEKIYDKLGRPEENNLNHLKLQQLLFLTVNASLEDRKDENDIGLLSIFDNWYSAVFTNLEKDIYDYNKKHNGEFEKFTLTRLGLVWKNSNVKKSICDSIEKLQKQNSELIKENTMNLQEIICEYKTYIVNRKKRQDGDVQYHKINNVDILNEPTRYFTKQFMLGGLWNPHEFWKNWK